MKKLSLAISAIMLFALCSCNYSFISMNNRGKDFINHSYVRFGGEKNYTVNVDTATVFTIESTVNSGSISIKAVNGNKEQLLDRTLETGSYTFNGKKDKYVFTINADDTSGEYKITWKPQ